MRRSSDLQASLSNAEADYSTISSVLRIYYASLELDVEGNGAEDLGSEVDDMDYTWLVCAVCLQVKR